MPWQEATGFIAGILTTLAVIPQISKAWKTREVKDISLITFSMLVCGLGLWAFYGFVIRDWPIMIMNGISCLLNGSLLCLVLYEKSK